ncbi:MAG TPA: FAD-dependent oxidoreductase [Xanthobacteraceae bacterium]|nr:FAD-dependent oxidoreductase [Xanthobacteraceae bacterium]
MAVELASAQCCIAGGGPAGIMAGVLLARAGVDVLVLEKYPDFFRDFRGDTIHPSTLELMYELGFDRALLRLPHQKVTEIAFHVGEREFKVADCSHLNVHHPFVALMPQWDFLNFLAERGAQYPGFRLRKSAEVTGLVEREGRVTGVRVNTREGDLEVRADLVLGADGRHSTVREKAGLALDDIGAPIDVLWFRLSRPKSDPAETMARLGAGHFMVMLNRDDYWQCAFVIPKGDAEKVRQRGLFAFRKDIAELAPFAKDRVEELSDWDGVKLLTVQINRLQQWYRPGLLCIGDAAHAMSPVGGVGINLAIQDAVAAANILAAPLREKRTRLDHLRAVQRRREWPAKITQAVQVQVQNRILRPILDARGEPKPPFLVRLLDRFPLLRRLPAYAIGIGARPEHIRTPVFAGH